MEVASGQLFGVVQSFFGGLKKESVKKHDHRNRELAVADVAACIDAFHCRTRCHSHLGGGSPGQFEATQTFRRRAVHEALDAPLSTIQCNTNRPRSATCAACLLLACVARNTAVDSRTLELSQHEDRLSWEIEERSRHLAPVPPSRAHRQRVPYDSRLRLSEATVQILAPSYESLWRASK